MHEEQHLETKQNNISRQISKKNIFEKTLNMKLVGQVDNKQDSSFKFNYVGVAYKALCSTVKILKLVGKKVSNLSVQQ